jgi:zinc protease
MSTRTNVRFLLVATALAAVLTLHAGAQQVATSPVQAPAQAQSQALALTQAMPVDPQITTGRFSNGLRYYLRTNKLPEKRMELRLAVNAGSVLEDDDQLGLAHMLEHMAFNGTAHFQKQEIVSFMESIGMRFGPSLNAFTSFDETVYMLTVPTDKAEARAEAHPD